MSKFKIYRRGQLIFYNFENAVGFELSGKHPAIVITKKDTAKNGVLTVIPLSSQNKPYYLPLGDIVSTRVCSFIDNRLNIMDVDIEEAKALTSTLTEETLKSFNSTEVTLAEVNDLRTKTDELAERVKFLRKKQKENERILKIHKTNLKSSYALVQNIITISKDRILPFLGEYDPLNNFIVGDEILDKIDCELKNKFIR